MKDSSATISSIDQMINETSLLPARDSRHEQALSQRRVRSQWEKNSAEKPYECFDEAQHERKISNDFTRSSVRPEVLEG
jgi:hypothetical protein